MRILQQRLDAYRGGHVGPSVSAPALTCTQLWEEFVSVRFGKMSASQRQTYALYFALVPPNASLTDARGIGKAVLAALAKKDYAHNTKWKALSSIRSVFAFGMERGLVSVNPIHPDMIPGQIARTPVPYTHDEITAGLEAMRERYPRWYPYLLFLVGSACRPVEAMRLEWSHVHSDHVVVHGFKGKAKTARYRVIPYELCPQVAEAVELCRGVHAPRVFGGVQYTTPKQQWNECVPVPRGLYAIRKATINRWRALGWPEKVRHAIAGHDRAMAEAHYEAPYSASELASIVQASR